MKIALTGPMFAGKTSLADYLEAEHGWTKLNYTDTIKVRLCDALNGMYKGMGSKRRVTVTNIAQHKRTYRKLLQEFGSFLGYDDGFYVDEMLNQWRALGSPEPVIFDNVRFPAQFEALYEEGFVLVGIELSPSTQYERAKAAGVTSAEMEAYQAHAAENGVGAEIWLDGELPVEENANILNRLAGIRLPKPGRTAPIAVKAA